MNRALGAVLVTVLTGAACGNSSTGPAGEPNDASTKTRTATRNGTNWTAVNEVCAWLIGDFDTTPNNRQGRTLGSVAEHRAPGTCALGPCNANIAIAQWIDSTGSRSAIGCGGSGTLTLTTVSLQYTGHRPGVASSTERPSGSRK